MRREEKRREEKRREEKRREEKRREEKRRELRTKPSSPLIKKKKPYYFGGFKVIKVGTNASTINANTSQHNGHMTGRSNEHTELNISADIAVFAAYDYNQPSGTLDPYWNNHPLISPD